MSKMEQWHKRVGSPQGLQVVANCRSICADLPEVIEHVDGFLHTTFRVSDKPLIMIGEYDKDGETRGSIAVKADRAVQEMLVQQGDYYVTPYIGRHGWVSVNYMDTEPNWTELAGLIVEAYCRVAPKRLVKLFQQQRAANK